MLDMEERCWDQAKNKNNFLNAKFFPLSVGSGCHIKTAKDLPGKYVKAYYS
jgi:hypothetical protein